MTQRAIRILRPMQLSLTKVANKKTERDRLKSAIRNKVEIIEQTINIKLKEESTKVAVDIRNKLVQVNSNNKLEVVNQLRCNRQSRERARL